jgi:hypothetical protein
VKYRSLKNPTRPQNLKHLKRFKKGKSKTNKELGQGEIKSTFKNIK